MNLIETNTSGICFGTGITDLWRSNCDHPDIMTWTRYQINNYFHNKKQWRKDHSLESVVQAAVENGCTVFDTSRAYANSEKRLGQVLKRYKRDDSFVITKLCNKDQYSSSVREGLMKSLHELDMDYVDLYLMHWPVADHYLESWKEMEKLQQEGLCRKIGVCNCNIHHLEAIAEIADVMPACNEFECHPLFTQTELRAYCMAHGIQVLAYTSTARNDERLKKTVIMPVAKKYGKSMTQIILKWHVQSGTIPIVNSTSVEHMISNTKINDFSLTDEEMLQIDGCNINSRLRYDPDNCDFHQL